MFTQDLNKIFTPINYFLNIYFSHRLLVLAVKSVDSLGLKSLDNKSKGTISSSYIVATILRL